MYCFLVIQIDWAIQCGGASFPPPAYVISKQKKGGEGLPQS